VCFSIEGCKFPNVEECLRQALFLAQREIAGLKERANLKHTRISLKWRDSSFYYKKRAKQLEEFITKKGLEVPLTMKEKVQDEGLDSSNQEDLPGSVGDDIGSTK
jgi:hypothetical protein